MLAASDDPFAYFGMLDGEQRQDLLKRYPDRKGYEDMMFRPRSDLSRAKQEYGSSRSPYKALDDYLMQKPVFDRGSRADPKGPSMSRLSSRSPYGNQMSSNRYGDVIKQQGAIDAVGNADRQLEIDDLRKLLQADLSSSEDAALSQRSDITKSLEGRIDELRSGIDSETDVLRQSGLDERASLLKQLAAGDERISSAQTEALGSLEDRQGSLIGDLKGRIG